MIAPYIWLGRNEFRPTAHPLPYRQRQRRLVGGQHHWEAQPVRHVPVVL